MAVKTTVIMKIIRIRNEMKMNGTQIQKRPLHLPVGIQQLNLLKGKYARFQARKPP